ncbi:MAG TPA: M23 family metallopeptidase [Candidatus Merdenecus merdavium]|nr:M23 family metallopeptidase [Candidatus Merdenecus merdavium]
MKKKNTVISFLKRKEVIAALSFCLVAVIALAGAFSIRGQKESPNVSDEELVDLDESPDVDYVQVPETELETTNETEKETATKEVGVDQDSITSLKEDDIKQHLENNNEMDVPEDLQLPEDELTDAASTGVEAGVQTALSFSEDSKISWPIEGNVILNYSMDKSVYFSTLDQYKYNPALIISAQVNDPVSAGVQGVVESIYVNEETGTTLTLDLGDGYKGIYGQLKEVPLSEGERVDAGTVIGYIQEPTKYYSVEGSNLYFKLTKDDQPVDPMTHFE